MHVSSVLLKSSWGIANVYLWFLFDYWFYHYALALFKSDATAATTNCALTIESKFIQKYFLLMHTCCFFFQSFFFSLSLLSQSKQSAVKSSSLLLIVLPLLFILLFLSF